MPVNYVPDGDGSAFEEFSGVAWSDAYAFVAHNNLVITAKELADVQSTLLRLRKLNIGGNIDGDRNGVRYGVSSGLKKNASVARPLYAENLLINGGFDFAQRQAPGTDTTIGSGDYGPDRWKIERENDSAQYSRQDAFAEIGIKARYFGKFTKITNAGKLLIIQIIEGRDSAPMRGRSVRFQCKMKASAAKTIRMAVIELQNAGTMDGVNATFSTDMSGATGVDPTLNTDLAVITGAQNKSVTTDWQEFSVSVTVPSNSKNLICALWSDADFAAADWLAVTEAGLYDGTESRDWLPRSVTDELLLCQRYYWKTFDVDVAPAEGSLAAAGLLTYDALLAAASSYIVPVFYPVQMRNSSGVPKFFNFSSANAKWWNNTGAADSGTPAAVAQGSRHVMIQNPQVAGDAVGNRMFLHMSMRNEL